MGAAPPPGMGGMAILKGGKMGEQCTQTHSICQRGNPIGWGAIKTHCTEMYSVCDAADLLEAPKP